MGARGTIHLGDNFFLDNLGGGTINSKGYGLGGKITSAAEGRELIILHELRHVITGLPHPFESAEDVNRNIIKNCGF